MGFNIPTSRAKFTAQNGMCPHFLQMRVPIIDQGSKEGNHREFESILAGLSGHLYK